MVSGWIRVVAELCCTWHRVINDTMAGGRRLDADTADSYYTFSCTRYSVARNLKRRDLYSMVVTELSRKTDPTCPPMETD